jgi:hypothetical protein
MVTDLERSDFIRGATTEPKATADDQEPMRLKAALSSNLISGCLLPLLSTAINAICR